MLSRATGAEVLAVRWELARRPCHDMDAVLALHKARSVEEACGIA